MKKIIFVAFTFISLNAVAQDFQIGLKAGVNISNFTGDFDSVDKKALIGFHGGAFIRFRFNKIAIQPEVLLSTQGAKFDSLGKEKEYRITYINVPIMVQYETDGGFYLEAGPQFGFKVDESVPSSSVEDFAKSSDVSICFGLGYHSKIGLGIGARYNVGLSKVGDFDSGNIDPDFKNGVAQISLFYTIFNNKKK